jgi:hypothetical protein
MNMIRIEWGPENECIIVDGFDEFIQKLKTNASVEVVGFFDGRNYYVHELGERLYILDERAQTALARLADLLIQEAAIKRWH